MPTILRQPQPQAIQAPSNFPIGHETLKICVEGALILGFVIVLVLVALIMLGPVPSAITNVGLSHV